jgi:hypothetical protein
MLNISRQAAQLAFSADGNDREVGVAKRSSNIGLGWVVGAFVLVILVPKEVWIALGVILGVAGAIFVGIKFHAARKVAKQPPPAPAAYEPTLAEWMASNHQSPAAPAKPSAPSRPTEMAKAPPSQRVFAEEVSRRVATDTNIAKALSDRSSPAAASQPLAPPAIASPIEPQEALNADRQIEMAINRERAQALRERIPETDSRSAAPPNSTTATPPKEVITQTLAHPGRVPSPTVQPAAIAPEQALAAPAVVRPERTLGDFMRMLRGAPEPEKLHSAAPASQQGPAHTLPAAPEVFRESRWVGPNEAVQLAGLSISGGMLYIGPKLLAPTGAPEPALISPQLSVASHGDFRERHTNYWPSYAELTPVARRAYLRWLAEGRSHPSCDIGFVFLFFYGLERRVFIDAQNDPAAKSDWPAILVELRRLLAIYGEGSASFKRYAGELLSWLELDGGSNRLYEHPVPSFPRTYELPPYVRLALGQAAVDRKPLPAALALAWVRLSPDGFLRTPATRCPTEFEHLFAQRYRELLGEGLVLPKNRTKLKFVYQPASGGLRGTKITMGFEGVPDVTALTAPIKTLREIAEQCTTELGSYSRLVGKDSKLAGSLEALLLLPASLWPQVARSKLQELVGRMRHGRIALPLRDLLAALGGTKQSASREVVRALARALEGEQSGMEPHVLRGARAPTESDMVVLFSQPVADSRVGTQVEYQTGALTLQLAAAMAMADGDFHAKEAEHLRVEIDRWTHLNDAERTRLHAHLRWLITAPPTLASLKKKLEPLSLPARQTIAAFMASLAQSDGFVSPDEMKFLEKLYKALGVEPKRVFSDVHAASASPGPSQPLQTGGFRLDADRIASRQADTARVAALLSKIFTEEPLTPAPEPEPALATDAESGPLLALDASHTALLRLMLSRPSWSRAELEDAAADLELMLDGALEQINEAAFDAFDAPLCEGHDPVDVNSELLEKLEA